MSYLLQALQPRREYIRIGFLKLTEFFKLVARNVLSFFHTVKRIGATEDLDDYEKSRLGIFNYLNFFQLISGIIVPVLGLLQPGKIPVTGWLVACMPPLLSVLVLALNHRKRFQEALMVYFILYPVLTCFSYINGIDFGIELSFILYGILAVFFIKDIGYMIFAISFSMISYFILSVVLEQYQYKLASINYIGYLVNQALLIIYIFYGLYLIIST